jgi:PAS domain S-box-containing protein/putative nucleotidyltransferase with HDIG domain
MGGATETIRKSTCCLVEEGEQMARVLIVDDELSIRSSLGTFAEQDGHKVSLASVVAEALDLLGKESFDIVVTDIIMPRRSGVDLLTDIRQDHPDVQVIMITGEPDVSTAAKAVRNGAFDYLSKPVSRDAISRVLTAAAAKKVLIDENRGLMEDNRRYREHLERQIDVRTEQLRNTARRYENLFNSIADPVFVVDSDTNCFLDCNQVALDRYGYTKTELGAMTPHDLHPRDKKELVNAHFDDTASFSDHSYIHSAKDGEQFLVEVHTNSLEFQGREALISIVRDVTKREAAESKAQRLLAQQICVNSLALELGMISDIDQIYAAVHKQVRAIMDTRSFIISFYDDDQQLIRAGYAVFQERSSDVSKLPPIPLEQKGRRTQSQVIHTGEPLYLPDYCKAREKGSTEYTIDDSKTVRKGEPPGDAEDMTRSALFVPLKIDGKVIGVMQVQSYSLDAYTDEDMALLGGLANVSAVAIANSRLVQQIREALAGTVGIVGKTVEIRDPYTAGHQRRVSELACAIGRDLGLPDTQIDGLQVAGLLHDIGKISIPAEILSKPTRLSETEFALIESHPTVGYDLLRPIQFPWPVAQIVLQHHERMDGSGYPQALTGEDLLPEARILAVCDVVEAMESHRPYRPSLGIEAALDEIEKGKSDLYDSAVVDVCIALFREKGFKFSE